MTKSRALRALVVTVALLAARRAAGGAFDTSFGGTGIVHDPAVDGRFSGANAMAIQPNGAIVAAGFTGGSFVPTNGTKLLLTRVLADGTFDAAFGTAGIVATAIGDSAYANAVALQTDGMIVVAGRSSAVGLQGFTVARYDTSGALDATFGVGGIVVIPERTPATSTPS